MASRSRKSSPGKRTKKSTKGLAKPLGNPSSTEDLIQAADFASLDEFCGKFPLLEVPLEQWTASHSTLDLTIYLFLTKDEAVTGGNKEVRFSRMVSKPIAEAEAGEKRERCSWQIVVPSNAPEGHRITVPGMGDHQNETCGSLHIIIRIRS